jgi:nicotinate-nucleotide--dimethylbenzimidazole phosphoribosyltransferase
MIDKITQPPQLPLFGDLLPFFDRLPDPDEDARTRARERNAQLLKPSGSLGRLEQLVEWMAAWQGCHPPRVERAMVAVFAGNHGVTVNGISPYPASVTAQMVEAFRVGNAAINQICQQFGAGLQVFDLALEEPTGDITKEPAMSETDCAAAFLYGRQAIADSPDIVCLGEMGIGNTTIAAALAHALVGGRAQDWVGPGTGAKSEMLERKLKVVADAVALHRTDEPLEVLRRLGGREFAAIAGAIIAARYEQIPVILDGYCSCAAAAVIKALNPGGLDHCVVGHLSAEPAHQRLLEYLDLHPILDLDMHLGEASGAALALAVVNSAVRIHTGMATFDEAGISQPD